MGSLLDMYKNLVLKNLNINIRPEKVLAGLRFRKDVHENSEVTVAEILKEIQKVYSYIETIAVYRIQQKIDSEYLYSESRDVKQLLADSEKIVIFAVSIGKNIDEKISEYLKTGDVMAAAVWDAIGSEAVEQCANYVNEYIKTQCLLKDFFVTKRYSAGYGDWDLTENFKIAEILELETFNIRINETGLFYPQKFTFFKEEKQRDVHLMCFREFLVLI